MNQKIIRVVLTAAVPKETPEGEVQALLDSNEIDVYLSDYESLREAFLKFNANTTA